MKEKDQNAQVVTGRSSSTQARPSNTPAPAALPARPVASAQPSASPAPAAQPAARTSSKPIDYDIDRQYGVFLFRQGEMVWFERHGAWGLGVLLERWKVGNQSHYRVQPLSYPGHQTQSVDISKDVDLRPWLAWTVPPYTHEMLNKATNALTYNNFDFVGLSSGKYGPGTLEIDASIMAAKAIDASYTPFGPESRSETQAHIEVRWSGIYLGAEKIWVNEPVRLVLPAGQGATRVLVVRAILERTQKSAQAWSSISFIGDIYVMLPVEPITMNQAPNGIVSGSDTTNVPSRMLEDIRRRNSFTIQARGSAHHWKLLERSKVVDMKDIRGRWYESTLYLHLLLPGQSVEYETKAREGQIKEVLSMMNGHGDCNLKDGTRLIPDTRAPKREQAFGKAVPARTEIVDGVKQSQPQQQQARGVGGPGFHGHAASSTNPAVNAPAAAAHQAQKQQHQQPMNMTANQATGFEDFMDLEGLGDTDMMGGFDQSYV